MNRILLLACTCLCMLFFQDASAQADAEVATFASPDTQSFCPATLPISINIYNNDLVDITEVVLDWTINGVSQLPVTWSGLIAAGDITPVELDPAFDFQQATTYVIEVTIQSVNTLPDPNPSNDTFSYSFDAFPVPPPQFYWDGCGLDVINGVFGSGDYDSIVWLLNGVPDQFGPDFHYYTPSVSGIYSVIGYTVNTGCEATIDSEISVTAIQHGITALGLTTFCEGDSVGLVFSAAVQVFYTWNTGSTDDTIYASTDGWFGITGVTANSCPVADSILVTVHPTPVVVITDMLDTLVSNYSGFHQWYYNGNQIAGAHDSTYVPTQSGTYYCTVTSVYGCTGTSNSINWIMPGISVPVELMNVMVYPNPAHDVINIRFLDRKENFVLTVYDVQGRVVMQQEIFQDVSIDISRFAEGVYQCVFTGENQQFSQKLVKTF
jgi:hypothetical protein